VAADKDISGDLPASVDVLALAAWQLTRSRAWRNKAAMLGPTFRLMLIESRLFFHEDDGIAHLG
jgi:hypothetical protein